jgi:hypothetical protein
MLNKISISVATTQQLIPSIICLTVSAYAICYPYYKLCVILKIVIGTDVGAQETLLFEDDL